MGFVLTKEGAVCPRRRHLGLSLFPVLQEPFQTPIFLQSWRSIDSSCLLPVGFVESRQSLGRSCFFFSKCCWLIGASLAFRVARNSIFLNLPRSHAGINQVIKRNDFGLTIRLALLDNRHSKRLGYVCTD